MRHLVRLAILVIAILVAPLISSATVVGACKTKLAALCTQSVDINPAGTQFTIVLTNTSLSLITADAFSLPGTLGASLLSATNPAFRLISGDMKVVPVTPFREFLLTIDPRPNAKNSFEGGGSPKSGIAAGSTETFIFNIIGGTLADTFANESSIFDSQVIRSRGSSQGDSEQDLALFIAHDTVAPGHDTPRPKPVAEAASSLALANSLSAVGSSLLTVLVSVPEPASFLMFGVGLLAFSIVMTRKNARK